MTPLRTCAAHAIGYTGKAAICVLILSVLVVMYLVEGEGQHGTQQPGA